MKNRIKYLLIVIVVGLVSIFLMTRKNLTDNDVTVQLGTPITKNQMDNTHSTNEEALMQDLGSGKLPKWAQTMMDIDNQNYTREEKIDNLVALLKQNALGPQAVTEILVSLTGLNPLEATDDIIPYLQSTNPRVQSATLGALNNASLLTEEEHTLKHALPENEEVRKRIAEAVNEVKANPNTTKEVREALISTYAVTNPSLEDSQRMNKEILKQKEVSHNEASYVATSVLNGKDVSSTLEVLNTKTSNMKDSVISSIGANILENPNVVSTLSKEQRKQLTNFINNNPPSTTNPNDFGYQNDQWKNVLSVLNNYIE